MARITNRDLVALVVLNALLTRSLAQPKSKKKAKNRKK